MGGDGFAVFAVGIGESAMSAIIGRVGKRFAEREVDGDGYPLAISMGPRIRTRTPTLARSTG